MLIALFVGFVMWMILGLASGLSILDCLDLSSIKRYKRLVVIFVSGPLFWIILTCLFTCVTLRDIIVAWARK
jgi:hypothetical protein